MGEPGSGGSAVEEAGQPGASRWTTQGVWARQGALVMAPMNIHLCLQLGLNHLDRKIRNFKFWAEDALFFLLISSLAFG